MVAKDMPRDVLQGRFELVSVSFLLLQRTGKALLQLRDVLVGELLVLLLYIIET